MTIVNPPNEVTISRSADSYELHMILDGYDLAPHVQDWSVRHENPATEDGVLLTVTILCSRLVMDVSEVPLPHPAVPSPDVRGGCA